MHSVEKTVDNDHCRCNHYHLYHKVNHDSDVLNPVLNITSLPSDTSVEIKLSIVSRHFSLPPNYIVLSNFPITHKFIRLFLITELRNSSALIIYSKKNSMPRVFKIAVSHSYSIAWD